MSTKHASGHQLHVSLGDGLWDALHNLAEHTGESVSHIVRRSLADSLDLDHHTIYQVSTSGALVEGVYQGCVRVADLKGHGDFGIGIRIPDGTGAWKRVTIGCELTSRPIASN